VTRCSYRIRSISVYNIDDRNWIGGPYDMHSARMNLRELLSTVTSELRTLIQCWYFVLRLLKIIVGPLRVSLLWNVYISGKCQRNFLKILLTDCSMPLRRIRVHVDYIYSYLYQDRIWQRAFVNTMTNTWVKGEELRRLPKEDSASQNMLFKNIKTLVKITACRG
jgi:hypothetical protein